MEVVFINSEEEPYALDADGRLDLSDLNLQSITLQGVRSLVDRNTGRTKEPWQVTKANLEEYLERQGQECPAPLGSKLNPLQVKGQPKRDAGSLSVKDAVKEAFQEQQQRLESIDTITIVGSTASSGKLREATDRLQLTVDYTDALTPAMKKALEPVLKGLHFRWTAGETDPQQVELVRSHLQEYYAPPDVTVVSVTGASWLDATFPEHHVVIKGTKTDYVFLSDWGKERYDAQPLGATCEERLAAALPEWHAAAAAGYLGRPEPYFHLPDCPPQDSRDNCQPKRSALCGAIHQEFAGKKSRGSTELGSQQDQAI